MRGRVADIMRRLGLEPEPDDLSGSGCFPDGRAWHIEIPSVEGPAALAALIDEGSRRAVRIDRASQGSGVSLLTNAELNDMAAMAREAKIELLLWAGIRAAWDISAMARSSSGASGSAAVRGRAGVEAGVEEALRAADAGVDGVLVADAGLLWALGEARKSGDLPVDFVLKTSLALPTANPAAARVYVQLGANSLNLPTDLPVSDIASLRHCVSVPLDCYIEGADDFAGPLRYHELEAIVSAGAPVHLKFGLRNIAGTYPAGGHVEATVLAGTRERVRRASIAMELLARRESTLTMPVA